MDLITGTLGFYTKGGGGEGWIKGMGKKRVMRDGEEEKRKEIKEKGKKRKDI